MLKTCFSHFDFNGIRGSEDINCLASSRDEDFCQQIKCLITNPCLTVPLNNHFSWLINVHGFCGYHLLIKLTSPLSILVHV